MPNTPWKGTSIWHRQHKESVVTCIQSNSYECYQHFCGPEHVSSTLPTLHPARLVIQASNYQHQSDPGRGIKRIRSGKTPTPYNSRNLKCNRGPKWKKYATQSKHKLKRFLKHHFQLCNGHVSGWIQGLFSEPEIPQIPQGNEHCTVSNNHDSDIPHQSRKTQVG